LTNKYKKLFNELMAAEIEMSFGLLPDDEKEFLEQLAKIDSLETRLELVNRVSEARRQIEADEKSSGSLEDFDDVEAKIALFMYMQGVHKARMQGPMQTLRRIAQR
jgi:cell fate (sporulation/competence/biofilm development) regulator YlbF (YheA/YmcA/DUF963 family)